MTAIETVPLESTTNKATYYIRISWYIILIALIVRLFAAFTLPVHIVNDQYVYHQYAIDMAENGSYVNVDGNKTAYRPVGYITFLASHYRIFGPNPIAVRVTQVLLSTLSLIFLGYTALRIGNSFTARLATWIGAFFPTDIFYSQLLYSETLFIFLQWTVILLLLPWLLGEKKEPPGSSVLIRFIAAGLISGLLTLIKAHGLLILPALLVVAIVTKNMISRRTILYASLSLILCLSIASMWVIRNRIQLGTYRLSTNGGVSLWTGNHPGAYGGYEWLDPNSKPPRFELESDNLLYKFSFQAILDNPLDAIKRIPRKLSFMLKSSKDVTAQIYGNGDNGIEYDDALRKVPYLLLFVTWLYHIAVFIAGWSGWWYTRTGHWRWWVMSLVLLQLAITVIFFGTPRFAVTIAPFVILSATKLPLEHKDFDLKGMLPQQIIWLVGCLFLFGIWIFEGAQLFTL
jgi:4-amino-4-deoxy-L-arabinose transferase-like glycosyltransferase